MRTLVCLLLVSVASSLGLERYHIEVAHQRRHHHRHEEDVVTLAQEDEGVEEKPVAVAAEPTPVVQDSGTKLSCQEINGKTICMPTGMSSPTTTQVEEAPRAATSSPASDPIVAALTQKLQEKTIAAETSTEMAKEMVQEVRTETREILEEAQNEAKLAREENDELRLHILDLEEKLAQAQSRNSEPAAPAPVAPADAIAPADAVALATAVPAQPQQELNQAMGEFEKLKKEYEALL